MLGSFVDGLFEGAKSSAALWEARNRLEAQYRAFEDQDRMRAEATKQKAEADRKKDEEDAAKRNITGIPVADPTPPPEVTAPPRTTGAAPAVRVSPGDPALVDTIAPHVSRRESGDRPYVGYTPPDATPEQVARAADLSKNPPMPGYFGFPQWEGNPGPAGNSRSAGLFQFQPETWRRYAGPLGITDFSPESQRKVFDAAYSAEGITPWRSNTALIADLANAPNPSGGRGLLGGAAVAPVRTAAPVTRPSALEGGPAPAAPAGTAPPDLEGQRAKAYTGPIPPSAKPPSAAAATIGAAASMAPAAAAPAPSAPPQPSFTPPSAMAASAPAFARAPAESTIGSTMTSALSGPSAAGPTTVSVTPSPIRPVLASLRQEGGGMRPQQQGPPPPQQRLFRMPNGALVDGIGNIVRPGPSALYPRSEVS